MMDLLQLEPVWMQVWLWSHTASVRCESVTGKQIRTTASQIQTYNEKTQQKQKHNVVFPKDSLLYVPYWLNT